MFPDLTDEQRMIEETVAAVLGAEGVDAHGNIGPGVWPRLAELGMLALPLPEALGGLGAGPLDLAIILRELGKVPGETPFLGATALGASLLAETATEAQLAALLPGLLDGSAIVVPALAEPGARYDTAHVVTRASATASGYRLSGSKSLVTAGALATHFIVAARTAGGDAELDGISLFLIPADAPGLTVRPYRRHDGTHDADLVLEDVDLRPETLLGPEGAALAVIESATLKAMALSSAEAVGAMEQLLEDTLEHLRTRKQFGVPLGNFQVLQHAAVDMFVAIEQARAMAGYALAALTAPLPERRSALLAAKAQISGAARLVGETAVQLHGAIGITRECRAGRLFQRLTLFQLRFGDRAWCLSQLAAGNASLLDD